MAYKINITLEARLDLHKGVTYYNAQLNGLGNRFKEEVFFLIDRIRLMPSAASFIYYPTRYKPLSKFPYIILYETEGDIVQILRIFNTRQSQDSLKNL